MTLQCCHRGALLSAIEAAVDPPGKLVLPSPDRSQRARMPRLRKRVRSSLRWGPVIAALAQVACASGRTASDEIGTIVEDFANRGEFMGWVAVARAGTPIFSGAFGHADLSWGVEHEARSRFNVASLTKQFTAALVLRLAQEGKVTLGDSLGIFLPESPPAWHTITLEQMISHRAGFGTPRLDDFPRGVAVPYSSEELVSLFYDRPLLFDPGDDWAYSNIGYYILGLVVERVTGLSYGEALNRYILIPAQLTETGIQTHDRIVPRLANGYRDGPFGRRPAQYLDWSLPYAAGAVYSTGPDLLRWEAALATETVLSGHWRRRLFEAKPGDYAFGWFVRREGGRERWHHGGSNPGFASYIARFPADRGLIIILSNLEDAPITEIAAELEAALYPADQRPR